LAAVPEAPELSVVVPAYNEERRLPITLENVLPVLEAGGRGFEMILVDDGSSDATLAIMREWAESHPCVVVVAQQPNLGKGRAIAEGVKVARGRLVLVSDTDFSTPITELPKLEQALDAGADIAIGSRGKRGSQVELSQPVYRVLMGKTFNLIVQALILPGIWDTQCGFKLFRGPVAHDLFARLTTDGFSYDVDVLFRARRAHLRVSEVPVRWINSPESKVSPVRSSLQMLRDIFRLRFGR
jgi:dolichyl-phosphate beta-glucosyltransferase